MLFLITFGCFALVIVLMALGTVAGRGPLRGGCGTACHCRDFGRRGVVQTGEAIPAADAGTGE